MNALFDMLARPRHDGRNALTPTVWGTFSMKKTAIALACAVSITLTPSLAFAVSSLEAGLEAASSRVLEAVPPAGPDASGAIIRDASCFENQLGGGTPWSYAGAEQVDLPFAIFTNHEFWYDIWISPQGALSHDEGGLLAPGIEMEDEDLIRASEIYAPMFEGFSVWGWWDDDDDLSPTFGQHLSPVYYGFTEFEGRQALCVTWLDMVPQIPIGPPEWVENAWYPAGGYWTQEWDWDASRRNSFQVLLVDRSDTGVGNFDVVYNYDSIQWQVEQYGPNSETGELFYSYAEAGWSLGIPGFGGLFAWRGAVDGRVGDDGELLWYPQLPYPEEHWFPQRDADGSHDTFLDSSPTGLAVTSTNSDQLGRHVFEIRNPPVLLWVGEWTHGDRQYVAFGDSYQSGEGAGDFYEGTDIRDVNKCRRSEHAYPVLLDSWIPEDTPVTLDFWACSGARTWQMYLSGIKTDSVPWNDAEKPSQYPRLWDPDRMSYLDRLGDETWVVTIGIGGNDVGFEDVLRDCATSRNTCNHSLIRINQVMDDIAALRGDLEVLYGDIAEEAPNATVFVVGYPRLFASNEEIDAAWAEYLAAVDAGATQQEIYEAYSTWHMLIEPCTGINRAEQDWLNARLAGLNRQIKYAAWDQGAVYIDIEEVGDGREICSSDDSSQWFANGAMSKGIFIAKWPPTQIPVDEGSFHPNELGHLLIALEFVRQLAEPRYGQAPFIYPGELKRYVYEVIGGFGSVFHIAANWAGSDVEITLISPSGVVYTRASEPPGSIRTTGPRNEYIQVTDPESGTWTIEAYGADVAPGGESFLLDLDFEPPPNRLPTGVIQLDRHGSTITVSAPGSVDPDGTIVDYWWDLGDGTLVNAQEATHTFAGPGLYRIALVLTDDRGGRGFVFLEDPVVIEEPSTGGSPRPGPTGTPEPEPSPSPSPQASASPGVDHEPNPEPSPSPPPTTTESGDSGWGGWLWWIALALVAFAVAAVGLWHRRRR